MSCYNWERGVIKLPSKEWPKFRKGLIEKWNEQQLEVLEKAQEAHLAATAAAKGRKGKARQPLVLKAVAAVCGGSIDGRGYFTSYGRRDWDGSYEDDSASLMWDAVKDLILVGSIHDETATKTKNPQKKDLAIWPVSKSCTLTIGEASVSFDNDARSVSWDVYENNHSVERARGHWYAKALFRALSRIEWTRGTGGKIIGNDEYNKDSDCEGGGGNYVTSSFGPLGKTRGLW